MQNINVQQYNNNVDIAVFKFKRYYNGIDLDDLTCSIYTNNNKIIAGIDDMLIKTSTEDLITLKWTISSEFTKEKTKFQIVFEDETKIYLSSAGCVSPRESIDIEGVNHTTYEHNLGLLEQWQNNMVGLRQTCDSILTETKVLANETSKTISNCSEVIQGAENIITQAQASVDEKMTVFFDKITSETISEGVDIWNIDGAADGEYMRYTDGAIRYDVTFFRTAPLPCVPSRVYKCKNSSGSNFSAQVCFLNSDLGFISGISLSSSTTGQPTPTITTPSDCKYIVFSTTIISKNLYSVIGATITQGFTYRLNKKYLEPTEILCESGANLRKVFETIKDASEINPYIVLIPEGTYDTLSYYTSSEKSASDFCGLFVPDHVTLKGVGKRENIILTATFDTANQNVSTLNLKGTSSIENLTVIGNKTRYAVHDDFTDGSGNPYKRKTKNCVIIGNNTYYSVAYGSGVWNGAEVLIEDCYIEAMPGIAYGWHTRAGFTIPTDTTFKKCTFVGTSNFQVKLGSKGSGVENKIHFIGCNLQGIQMREEVTDSRVGLDFTVDGYGNSKNVTYYVTVADGGNYYPKFNDEIVKMRAGNDIAKGTIVTKDYNSSYCTSLGAASVYRFFGIAMQDALKGEFLDVKTTGVVPIELLGLSSANNGDKVGINNGVVGVVTSNDYFAICKYKTHATIVL